MISHGNFRRHKLTLFSTTLVLCAVLAGSSQAQEHKLSDAKRTKIEAVVSAFMAESHVPGLSVAVVENGEYEWGGGFGLADIENNVPASEHTLFRLGSISKSLTATAAMELVERGKLDLDAPVQKYCPAFPQKPWPISTRQVMGHLGGIRHYKGNSQDDPEVGNTKHFENTIQSGLDFFKNDPLVSEPGKQFHYSTQGYTLVGCVIEGASAEKYVDFVRQNVFAPAGMEVTQADNRFAIVPYRTRFYQKTESGEVQNADFLDSSYKIPGGGWLSSAEDMARFEVAILNNKLMRRSTRDLMWTPLKPADGSKDEYALGWATGTEDGIAVAGHSGGQQGCSTKFLIAPAMRSGVVVLTNLEGADSSKLAREILKVLATAAP
ncbi:MAG TPA: serine hydrolase domain-containing protein [Candidatus Sulfotelmatobacter sp.]|jgi:CubicO group peptidase (beta-lactamase class C family)|nr:serine hydrolase domain-containing protein [Candidatus Sulfotelmatobacter sp.]